MKKSVMKKWVKALRSGKYKQEKNFLENLGGYCCLGVLCKIAEENNVEIIYSNNRVYGYDLAFQPGVKNWAKMNSENGEYKINTNRSPSLLTIKNDNGLSFKQIASIIERQWKKL